MARQRWIYRKDGEVIEVSSDYNGNIRGVAADSILWNDRAYQDMNDPRFASRSQHREYMAKHGLTTVSDYTGNEWKQREKQRLDIRTGVDRNRREFVEKAIHKLTGA